MEQTDLAICFLEAFDEMLVPLNQTKSTLLLDQLEKQRLLMKFIRMIEIIFTHKLCEQQNFKQALIFQVIHTLQTCIEDADVVEMAIYSM